MTSRHIRTFLLGLAALLPVWALAHTGLDGGAHHARGFVAGLLHPLTGADHLGAMLSVGLWSALTARRLWVTPLAFVSMLLVGTLIGLAGLRLPAVEPMIAVSLLVLGLLVATRTHAPAALAVALVGLFAVFHGVAHGSELAGDASIWPTLAGMLLCTVALHVTGLGLGLALRSRSPWWPRLAGGAVTTLGGALLLQLA